MREIDTLLHARWVIPVEPEGTVMEGYSLAIHEGRIVDLLPREAASERYRAVAAVELDRHALIPGLVNAHTHAAMALLRGLADDLPLMSWLDGHIWPAERRWVNAEFVHDGTQLAIAEMLRGGTTCFNDMYYFPDVTARVAASCGMRAAVGLIVIDFPTAWAQDSDEYLSKGLSVHDQFRGNPLITTHFAPHAPYTVSDAALQRIRVLADELDIGIHMHVHESAGEVRQSVAQTGMRPLERLHQLGLLSPSLIAVHMTQLTDEDIDRFAEGGGKVVDCPESNMKLASGFCPVSRLEEAGIMVALGTDGPASNNDLDMLGEARSAALLEKAVSGDARALPASRALSMATLHGAIALGLGEVTGSLLPGKWADITAVRMDGIETEPLYDPISQLVYATGRDKVTDVWVAGQHLLKDRVLTSLDTEPILARAREWGARIHATDQGERAH
jgi:5-methylthioadenosine/S-adenosylhomocysteine deaminase